MATSGDFTVRVTGLAELRRALADADRTWPRELGEANRRAAQVVAEEARRRAPAGPHQGGGRVVRLRASVRATRTQSAAVVSMGGKASPHAAPTEFGGTLRRYHSTARTTVVKRAFLYPAIEAKRDEVIASYARFLDQTIGRAFTG